MEKMLTAEIWTIARTEQGNAVLIRPLGADVAVPIFIGRLESQSILIGFGDVRVPRPLTHDLFLTLIHQLGAELLRIEINDIQDNTFYARLILGGKGFPENSPLVADARPSDALALAVRGKCPVFIDEKVVAIAGVPVDLLIHAEDAQNPGAPLPGTGKPGAAKPGGAALKREALLKELDRAVAVEAYERAAEIRDTLRSMNEGAEPGARREAAGSGDNSIVK
jgi:bifunctional DNase/RNase